MKRYVLVLLAATLAVFSALPIVRALAQGQAPATACCWANAGRRPGSGSPNTPDRWNRGRGRGPQTPPPPPLTCTSKALATDNKVPAALAKEGFTAIFNGKDLTGWQALIDIGTLKFGRGAQPSRSAEAVAGGKGGEAEGVERRST